MHHHNDENPLVQDSLVRESLLAPTVTKVAIPPAPPEIPGYKLLQQIGRGRFGEVWLATENVGQVRRALKILRKNAPGSTTSTELAGMRAYRAKSEGQPHLIQIHHVGETADCYYAVMELADRLLTAPGSPPDLFQPRTLAAEIECRGRFPAREALKIARDITLGLTALHGHGVFHRDIKPDNILYVGGKVKIADPSLVAEMGDQPTRPGTRYYRPPPNSAPEQWDLYSVGKILYQMATGLSPSQFPNLPQNLSELLRAEPRDLQAAIQIFNKAADANPTNGYRNAHEMLSELEKTLNQLDRRRVAMSMPAKNLRIVGAVALLIATFSGLYYWRAQPRPNSTAETRDVVHPTRSSASVTPVLTSVTSMRAGKHDRRSWNFTSAMGARCVAG